MACAFTQSLELLIAARFIQALGACAGIVVARAVVRDRFEAHESARVLSMLMLVMGAAPILASLIGGAVSQVIGWRVLFGLLAAGSLICWVVVFRLMPETRRVGSEKPRLLQAVRDRGFVGHALAGGLAYAGMFAYITGSPFVFIELFGIPSHHFGWVFGTNAAALIASSQFEGSSCSASLNAAIAFGPLRAFRFARPKANRNPTIRRRLATRIWIICSHVETRVSPYPRGDARCGETVTLTFNSFNLLHRSKYDEDHSQPRRPAPRC
jgi:predicted MFS family arabinose efflux permease